MAILNWAGLETGDLTEFSATSGTIAASAAIAPRSGDYCLRVNPTTTATGNGTFQGLGSSGLSLGLDLATLYFSCWFRIETAPGSGSEEIFRFIRSGPAGKLFFRITSDRKIDAYLPDGTTLLAAGTTVLSLNTWYLLEAKCGKESSASAGDAPYELKINGVSEFSGTAVLLTNNLAGVQVGKINNRNGQTIDVVYDDLILDDSAYPSTTLSSTTASIRRMDPDGDGNYTAWTGDVNDVNEIPHDSDTTFISTSTSTAAESVALESAATAGITGTVHSVAAYAVVREEPSVTSASQIRLRSGTTDSDTGSGNLTTTYALQKNVKTTDPATSAAWVLSALDSVEVGVEANAAVEHRCTMLCGMVLFTAGAAATTVNFDGVAVSAINSAPGARFGGT